MDLSETDTSPIKTPGSTRKTQEQNFTNEEPLPIPSGCPTSQCSHTPNQASPNGNTVTPTCPQCPDQYRRLTSTDSNDSNKNALIGTTDRLITPRAGEYSVEETLRILNNNADDSALFQHLSEQWSTIEQVLADKTSSLPQEIPRRRLQRYEPSSLSLRPPSPEHHSFFVTKALNSRRGADLTPVGVEDCTDEPQHDLNCNSSMAASSELDSEEDLQDIEDLEEDNDDIDDDDDDDCSLDDNYHVMTRRSILRQPVVRSKNRRSSLAMRSSLDNHSSEGGLSDDEVAGPSVPSRPYYSRKSNLREGGSLPTRYSSKLMVSILNIK